MRMRLPDSITGTVTRVLALMWCKASKEIGSLVGIGSGSNGVGASGDRLRQDYLMLPRIDFRARIDALSITKAGF
jgi:hypothetical protein